MGLADHLGWAIAVTARADGTVVDRRRIELVEPDVDPMPVHHGIDGLDDAAATDHITAVRASAVRATAAAFDELPGGVTGICIRHIPPGFPTDLATLRLPPWEARADAVMYRQVLADAAAERGWAVHGYDAKTVEDEVAQRFGPAKAHDLLHKPRAALGPPWAKDHRVALAATILG